MEKFKPQQLFELLGFLCFIGIGIMRAAYDEDGFSIATYYIGLGVTLAGASLKVMTKPGIIILILGIAGNIFLRSTKPIGISAVLLGTWYLIAYGLLNEYKDENEQR